MLILGTWNVWLKHVVSRNTSRRRDVTTVVTRFAGADPESGRPSLGPPQIVFKTANNKLVRYVFLFEAVEKT